MNTIKCFSVYPIEPVATGATGAARYWLAKEAGHNSNCDTITYDPSTGLFKIEAKSRNGQSGHCYFHVSNVKYFEELEEKLVELNPPSQEAPTRSKQKSQASA